MSENQEKMLNPQVTDVEIGIRSLRKITLYPLSMADQLKLSDIISKAIQEQFNADSDIAVVAFITNLLKDNMGRILTMATDEDGNGILEEMTNLQAAAIAETIYEVNYGVVAKNFKSLFGKLGIILPSGRPSPQSVNDTADIESTTSTESLGETEAQPSDSSS